MTCDEFLALIQADPKSRKTQDVDLAHKHFMECEVCKDVLGMNEDAMKWRNAWHELHAGSKNDFGMYAAIAICILLGILLFWSFARLRE
jgi:hypothetical protein